MSAKRRHQLVRRDGKLVELKNTVARVVGELRGLAEVLAREDLTPKEATILRNHAEALRVLARYAHLGMETQNMAARVRILAEMKVGKMLSKLTLRGGDRKSKVHGEQLKLEDLGLNHNESKRWQKLASVTEPILDDYALWANKEEKEVTCAGLLRWAAHSGDLCKRRQTKCRSKQGDSVAGHPNSSRVKGREWNEIIEEIRDHRSLLANMLRPVYESQVAVSFRREERRHISKLFTDIDALLVELREMVTEIGMKAR